MELEVSEQEIIYLAQWTVDNILIPHFMALGLDASGEWRNSLKVRAEGNKGIISGRKYTEQLVWGRMPGNRPPIQPLIAWAQVKLGLSGNEARSAAFAIANKIANEGTNIYQQGGTDLLEILNTPESLSKISEQLSGLYAPKIKAYLEREIKEAFI